MWVERQTELALSLMLRARSRAANFFHCQVWFGSDQLQQPSLVRIQQRTLAADRLSSRRSGLPPARNPPIAELGTSNAAAASWQDAPASIERTTRSRRSRE
jgi:hypothetical protein